MTIILTGATGFLGSHLASAFLQVGHKVIALKRQASDLHRLTRIRENIIFYDLEDLDFSRPFTEHGAIDAVVHTATCYGRAEECISQVFKANVEIPLRLLEMAALFSVETFFNTDTFFNNNTILYSHLSTYALTKKQFSEWGRQIAKDRNIRFVNIRLEHLYGPSDAASKFTTWIVRQCLENEPVIKLTSGEQRRDFIYIDDAVAAYCLMVQKAVELGSGFQEVGLGSGHASTIREFVEAVHLLSESRSELKFGALPNREHEFMQSEAENQRLNDMGWRCKIGMVEGIDNMITKVKKNTTIS